VLASRGEHGPAADSDVTCAQLLLAVMPRLRKHVLDALRDQDRHANVSIPQFSVLKALAEGDKLPSELARYLMVRLPTVTSLLSGIEERGWLQRRIDATNRRQVVVSLTPSGRSAYDRINRAIEDALVDLFLRLPSEDRRALSQGLQALDALTERLFDAVRQPSRRAAASE